MGHENAGPVLGMIEGDKLIHKGGRVDLLMRTVTTNSGKTQTREVVLHQGAVIILPVLEDGRVVLIRNRRHTIMDTLVELPAGTLERGEDPAVCAARELTEETGYTADRIEPLGWFYTSPGILTEKMYAFVATGLKKGTQGLEDNEQIEVVPTERAEVMRMIEENVIVDAKTIATVLKYFIRR